MLLYLDNSIQDAFSTPGSKDYNTAVHALSNLATASRYGHHIVIGDFSLLAGLSGELSLSTVSRAVFSNIYRNIPTMNSLLNIMTRTICVFFKSCTSSSRNRFSEFVELDSFASGTLTTPTTILSENNDDVKYLVHFGNFLIRNKQINGVKISAKAVLGGGNTTAKIFKQYTIDRSEFCLCFVDSDRKYPNASFGETANKVSGILQNTFANYIITPRREIENYIPHYVLFACYANDCNKKQSVDILDALLTNNLTDALRYIDIKEGLDRYTFMRHSADPNFLKFYAGFISHPSLSHLFTTSTCTNSPCKKCKPCVSVYIRSLGSHVLSDALKYINDIENNIFHCGPDQELATEVLDFGQQILNWCCGLEQDAAL